MIGVLTWREEPLTLLPPPRDLRAADAGSSYAAGKWKTRATAAVAPGATLRARRGNKSHANGNATLSQILTNIHIEED